MAAEGLDKHKNCSFLHQEPRQRKMRLQRTRERIRDVKMNDSKRENE